MVGRSFAGFIYAGHYDVFTFPKRLVNFFFSFLLLSAKTCSSGLSSWAFVSSPVYILIVMSVCPPPYPILRSQSHGPYQVAHPVDLDGYIRMLCHISQSLNAMDSSRLWLISLIYELIEKWLLSSHARRISHGIMVLLNGVLCTLEKSTSQDQSLSSSLKCGLHHPVGHWPMLLLQALMSQLSQSIETLTDAGGEIPVFSGSRV